MLHDVAISFKRHLISLFLTCSLLLTACGGGGDDEGDSTTEKAPTANAPADRSSSPSAPQPSQTQESELAPDPADKAIAEAALLTLGDFPVGWEAAPRDEDEDDRAAREDIAQCVGVSYDALYNDTNTEAQSPTFTSEDDSEIEHTVSIAVDEVDMTEAFNIASTSEFRECAAEIVRESVAENSEQSDQELTVGEISLNELSIGSFGDQTVAYRVTVPIETEGFNLEVKLEVAIVRVGRAQSNLTSTSIGSGISTEDLAAFVGSATQRLQDALADG